MPKLNIVELHTPKCGRLRVMCFDVAGFAVHPSLKDETCWRVTHRQSGAAMPLVFAERADAEKCAEEIAALGLNWDFRDIASMPRETSKRMAEFCKKQGGE